MAKNEVFRDADHLSLPVPAGTPANAAVIIGILVGVTETAEGAGGNPPGRASVFLKGGHRLAVDGAVTIGAAVYIPPGGGALTATATGNILFGAALDAKGAGVGVINVRVARV